MGSLPDLHIVIVGGGIAGLATVSSPKTWPESKLNGSRLVLSDTLTDASLYLSALVFFVKSVLSFLSSQMLARLSPSGNLITFLRAQSLRLIKDSESLMLMAIW